PRTAALDTLARLRADVPPETQALIDAQFDRALYDLGVHGDPAARQRLGGELEPAGRDLLDQLYRDDPLGRDGPFEGREWVEPPEAAAPPVQDMVREALPDALAAVAGPRDTHLLASA